MEIVECFVLVVSFLTSLTQAKLGGGGWTCRHYQTGLEASKPAGTINSKR